MLQLALALFAWVAAARGWRADALTDVLHVTMSDGARYDVPVARSGTPTAMLVYDGEDVLALDLRVVAHRSAAWASR